MTRVARFLSVLMAAAIIAGTAAGCKTMAKATGTHDVMLGATPDRVVDAVKGALGELEIKVTNARATKVDGEVNAMTAQGDEITIKIDGEGENVSRMTVKVGTLGDKTISQSIIDGTKKRLE